MNDTTTVAGAVDGDVREHVNGRPQAGRSPNVRWQRSALTREERWEALGCAGATIWFTGLPAAGKSTIAGAVEERLIAAGRSAFMLDGDNLRHGLNGDLGFDEDARRENVRRTAHVAKLLAESGTVALVGLVSPYASDREQAIKVHTDAGLVFLEVFIDTPLALCEQRDPKGLYARARAGELKSLTGIDAPYERPTQPDLVLRSGEEVIEDAVEQVMQALDASLARFVPSLATRD
ncbi:MAG TPA: adenylyl-sulfate kinase [Solirubrobacteraceae bacterium]|jgi:adenylyl-sulfate kinase